MSEWKEYKLGEICDVRDGTHDSPKQSSIGKRLVTSKNIKSGNIDLENTYLISEKDFVNINKRSKVDRYDILFSMIGTIGESAIIKDEPDYAIKNVGLFKTGGDEILAKWIYYYLKSNQAQGEIDANLKGSTQQYISLGDLRKFPIEMPNAKVQEQITDILSSLDDKIDLLNRQNGTLEAMAETLFRQWFVESQQESNIEDVLLGEVIDTTSGGTPSRKYPEYYQNGTIDWVKSKELLGAYIFETEERITEEALDNSSTKLIPKDSVLIAMYGATVGEYGIISKEMACNQAVCALMPNKNYPFTYLYLWAKLMQQEFINLSCGAAQQNISQIVIKQQYVCGDTNLIKRFHNIIFPYFAKLKNNQAQIRSLTKLRDTLLPKLMNNEIKM